MPTETHDWPQNCFLGQQFCDLITTSLPSVKPPATLLKAECTVDVVGTDHAANYYWWLEWRNSINQVIFRARMASCHLGETVTFWSGPPMGAPFYFIQCENDSAIGVTDCIHGRTEHSVGCDVTSTSPGIRGRVWCSYFDDMGGEWALQVDRDSALDTGRGFAPVTSSSTPPLPREWRPRRVRGIDAAGHSYFARVGRQDAPLWRGTQTTFNVETTGRELLLVQVAELQAETRIRVVNP